MNFAGKFGSGGLDSLSSAHVDTDQHLHRGHADAVTVPDAHLLFSGNFHKSGSDLVISDDLHRVVVQNYFHGDKRPTLVSPDGAPLDPKVIEALSGHTEYAQAGGAQAAKVVGHVVKMTGSASIVRNGVTIDVNNGDVVYQSDVVQTGSGSSLGLVLNDGTTFNLSAGARLMLNDLTYDANSTSNTALFSLVQGAASFVAGQVAKTGDMKVGTPVATMGIRGTAVVLDIDSVDGKVSISVVDQRDGLIHSVQVFNARGILIGTVTSNGTSLTLTPVANFEVIAQESNKTVAQIAQEFSAFQAALDTYQLQKAIDPNLPQHTDNGGGNNANPQTRYANIGSSTGANSPQTEFHSPTGAGTPPAGGGGTLTQVVVTVSSGSPATGSGGPSTPSTPDGSVIVFDKAVQVASIPFVVSPTPVGRITSGSGDHFGPVMSADGQFVTYDPDGAIYLFDRHTGKTITIAAPSGDFTYSAPTISSDGHYVVYQRSDGLTFIYDNNPADGARYQQTTQFVPGTSVAISGDGSTILVENGDGGIAIYDLQGHLKGTITPAVVGATGSLWKPAISADGHVIALWGSDSATAGGSGHLYTYNLSTKTVTEIATTAADAGTSAASISADGHYVVYQSQSPGGHSEIYLYDLTTGHVVFSTANASGASKNPVISPDGHFIVFASDAKLTPNDKNSFTDIYKVDLSDLSHPVFTLISTRPDGNSGNAASDLGASISLNGKIIVFGSQASDFSSGDDNGAGDIFVSDPSAGRDVIIQQTANSPDFLATDGAIAVTGGTDGVTISVSDSRFSAKFSDDGKFVLWQFSEAKSDFAGLKYGEDAGRSAIITLSFNGGSITTPVTVTVHNAIAPVITPVNAAPVLHSAILTLSEGDTVPLSPANIGISDVDDTSFTFKVTNVTHGQFQVLVGSTWYNTATFTSAELAAGQVRFMHDRGEQAPTFSIEADDGHGLNHRSNVLAGTVHFTNVNDAPVITAAAIHVSRGGTSVLDASAFTVSHTDAFADFSGFQTRPDLPEFSAVFTYAGATDVLFGGGFANNLSVNDPDSTNFTFTVSNVTHGVFQTTIDGVTWVDATTFTSADLNAGHVRFAQDGSAAAPTFSIQANDGAAVNNLGNVFDGYIYPYPVGPGIYGDVHDNSLTGTPGNDVLHGQGGDDGIDGLAGVDMAVYNGTRASYTVNLDAPSAGQIQVVDSVAGRDGTDTLTGIELLHFSDEIDLLVSGSHAHPVDISGLDWSGYGAVYPYGVTVGTQLIARTGNADDFVTVGQNVNGHAIDLGAGNCDTVNLSGTAGLTTNYTLDLQNVEKLYGSAADDSVGLSNNVAGMAIDLAGGNNTLYLAKGTNSLSVANVSNIFADQPVPEPAVYPPVPTPPPSDDTLTLLNNVSGVLIDLGGGTNTINLAAGTNSITVEGGSTIINGTSSKDTLTLVNDVHGVKIDLGAGDDTLTLGARTSGNTVIPSFGNTIVYADGDGADIVNGFAHGNQIDLTGVTGVHSLSDLNATQCGADTVIHFGEGSSLTLSGVLLSSLGDGDFVFLPNHAPDFTGHDLAPVYHANDGAVALISNVSATDPDSAAYAGGSLTATVTAGGHEGDTLSIVGNQHITVSGTTVMYDSDGYGGPAGAVTIGTVTNYDYNSLTVTLNGSAGDAAVAALAEAIEFSNGKSNAEPGTRTVTFTLHDGGGTANGGHDSDFFTATVDVGQDAAPAVAGDMSIVAVTGGEVALTVADLNAVDPDTDPGDIIFTIDGLNHGILTFGDNRDSLEVDDTFTLADVQAGRIYYQPDGGYTGSDHITLTLSDGVPGTTTSVVKLGATIVDAQFTVLTTNGYNFDQDDPIGKMGSGNVVPDGSDPDHSFRIVNSATNTDFIFTGTDFTYDDGHAPTGGTITFIQEVTHDPSHTPIANFGVNVSAADWYNATVAASTGDQSLIEALTRSWTFNFVGNVGADAFASGDVNDIFTGKAGSDTLDGQFGYDRANYGGNAGTIAVLLAQGTVVEFDADSNVTGTDTLRSIELVTGSNYNDVFSAIGFDATSQNAGSTVTNNVDGMFNEFEGRGGTDIIAGNGQTRVSYYHATSGVTVIFDSHSWDGLLTPGAPGNLNLYGGASGTATGDVSVGTDIFTGVNQVRGTFFNDSFTGSYNPNQTSENFEGLGGNDTIDGGLGFDRAQYFQAADDTGITVDLGAGTVVGGTDTGSDMLRSIEAIDGTNFEDTYDASGFSGSSTNAGNAGNNGAASSFNEFEGRAGDDTVTGNNNTRVAFYHATGGVVVTLGSGGTGDAFGNDSVGHDSFLGGVTRVRGSEFNDIITGNGGNNILEGQGGNDVIAGKGGNDTLTGGTGADIFVFGTGSGNDTITDFHAGEGDRLDLRGYNLSQSQITLFFLNNVSLTNGNADTLVTLPGGNTVLLSGVHSGQFGFSDIIFNAPAGSSVAITVQTPDGYDFGTLYNDLISSYQVPSANDSSHIFAVDAAKGITFEMIGVGFSYDSETGVYTDGTITEIKILDTTDPTKTTQDHVLVNSDGWNIDPNALFSAVAAYYVDHSHVAGLNAIFNAPTYSVVGSAGFADNNSNPHDGTDVFFGGDHADVFNGMPGPFGPQDPGSDTVDYSHATGPVSVNLFDGSTSGTAAAGDIFISIENLRGTDFADALTGDGNNNTLEGGLGTNTINGGGGFDVASYEHAGSAVTVSLAASGPQPTGGAGTDTLTNIEGLRGSSFADTLTGMSGNVLEGGAGDDHLIGQTGQTSVTASYEHATAGVSVSLAINGAQNTQGAGTDTLTNIANLSGSHFNDVLTGDTHDNIFFGNGDHDLFVFNETDGGIGHDTIGDFVSGSDHIELDYVAFDANDANSFTAWYNSHVTPANSGDLLIDLSLSGHDGVDTILLKNTSIGGLHANDFILHPGGGGSF